MVWANPRMRCPISDMKREWASLTETARIAPPEFKAYWEDRANKLAAGIVAREALEAEEAAKARAEASARTKAEREARKRRLEKAFPAMREARLEAQRSRRNGRP